MSKTTTPRQLLVVALQDLRDAEQAWSELFGALRDGSGEQVRGFLDGDGERSGRQAAALGQLLDGLGGERRGDPNIWLRAILDDAMRDIRSTVEGPLRDTALVGAFRKGKQAERVSYETAIALAAMLREEEVEATLTRFRDEEAAADEALATLLAETVDALR